MRKTKIRASQGPGFFLLAACLAASGIVTAQGQSWPMYQGNARHTAYVPVTLDPARFSLRWHKQRASVNGPYFDETVVGAEGKVFGVWWPRTGDAHLGATDPATGRLIWDFSIGNGAITSAPSYAHGKVYLVVHDGYLWFQPGEISLRAYDALTGALIFKTPHATTVAYPPTVENGIVYLPHDYGLAAIDAFNGRVLWSTLLTGSPGRDWTPAVDGSRAYGYLRGDNGAYTAGVYAVAALSGRVAFTTEYRLSEIRVPFLEASPVLGDDDDLLVPGHDTLMRFDLGAQRIRWLVKGLFSSRLLAVASGVVYAVNQPVDDVSWCGSSLDAHDEATGTRLWRWGPPHRIRCYDDAGIQSVIVTNSHLLVSTPASTYALELSTRRIVWFYPAGGGLALADGTLYIAGGDGLHHYAAIDTMTSRAAPVLDVRVNGVDGAITVTRGQPLSVSVSLDPRAQTGQRADWWVTARAEFGITYWLTNDGRWAGRPSRVYDGALSALSGYEVSRLASLPPGRYDVMFAVDAPDAVRTGTYFDTVVVTVQ